LPLFYSSCHGPAVDTRPCKYPDVGKRITWC
jgi:hypothetical protein